MIDIAKESIAKTFLESLRAKDWMNMRSCMRDDITWSLPGTGTISGLAVGVEATIEKAQKIASYGLTFTLLHLLEGADGFTLSLNNTAVRDGLKLDEFLATVCVVRDGRIASITTYLSDVPMMNAFFV